MWDFLKAVACLTLFTGVLNAKEFTYSGTDHFDKPSAFITLTLSQKLLTQGFTPLDQSNKGKIPLLNVDQVYQRNEQVVFFKQGITLPEKHVGKIIPLAGGFAYHGHLLNIPFAVFFHRFNENQVKELLKQSDLLSSFNISFNFSLFPKACASDSNCRPPVSQNLQNIAGLNQILNIQQYILKLAPTCAISALQGLRDGVEGSVESIMKLGRSIKSFFENPAALWEYVQKTYTEIEDFVKNFTPRMTEFLQSMAEVLRNPEVAGQLICSTLSSIIVQAAIGGGLAKGAIVIAQTFFKLEKVKSSLLALLSLKRRGHNTDNLTGKLVSCLR